jgi:sugar lactone lactonase YvrE
VKHRLVLGLALGLLLAAPGLPAESSDREAVRAAHAAALEAYEQGDHADFLRHSREVVDLAPRSTRALYNLACAQSLTGDAEGAVATLARLVEWGVAFDLDADDDFDAVRRTDGFVAVQRRMEALKEPVGGSPVAFTLPERDLLAEGVAHDEKTGDFFVSGVHRRKILRIGADGSVRDFVAEARDGLGSAVGIVVDSSRRALWVASVHGPLMVGPRDEGEERAEVLELDLDRATLRRRLAPPSPDGRLGDLALGPDGTLYAADPASGAVYHLPAGAEALQVLLEAGELESAQGLTVTPDGRILYVADYAQGIARVDLRAGSVVFLRTPEHLLTTGIDGLVLAGDSLVGIQNGLRPHRVVRLRLDSTGTHIVTAETLERAHPEFDEPTLGVLVGTDFFYVANSQYRHFDRDGTPDLERLQEPVVLRLPLDWLPRP